MTSATLLIASPLCATEALAQDFALKRFEESPRHHEWVQVKYGGRVGHSFLVSREKKEKTTAVIVIHVNRGLTDSVRGFADQLAEAGFITVAPDLPSPTGPGGGKTGDFANSDAAREGIYKLKPQQAAANEFVAPGRGTVLAQFRLTRQQMAGLTDKCQLAS